MSKLLLYCLLVIGVYVLVIFPLNNSNDDKEDSYTESKRGDNTPETGASGQLKYRMGLY